MMITDSFKHQGLRKKLIAELSVRKELDSKVLEAMSKIPRHAFMDSAFLKFAYEDQAFPIGSGQTISQPFTVAFQTTLLELEKGMKVLEIGTGSGYQTAVLSEMGIKVFTIERQKALYKKASKILDGLNSTAKVFYGDGYKGLPTFAPFDRILVTCGAPDIPEDLLSQLKLGGLMVIPVGEGDVQRMLRVEKVGEESFKKSDHGTFRFVPMLQNRQSY